MWGVTEKQRGLGLAMAIAGQSVGQVSGPSLGPSPASCVAHQRCKASVDLRIQDALCLCALAWVCFGLWVSVCVLFAVY